MFYREHLLPWQSPISKVKKETYSFRLGTIDVQKAYLD